MTNFLSDRQYRNWCRDEHTALEMLRDHNIIRVEPPRKFCTIMILSHMSKRPVGTGASTGLMPGCPTGNGGENKQPLI